MSPEIWFQSVVVFIAACLCISMCFCQFCWSEKPFWNGRGSKQFQNTVDMHVKIFQRGFHGWRWICWAMVTLVRDPPLWLKTCTPCWGHESFWLTQITQRNSKPLPALSVPLEKTDLPYSVHLSTALVPWRWHTKWSHHWVLHYGGSG